MLAVEVGGKWEKNNENKFTLSRTWTEMEVAKIIFFVSTDRRELRFSFHSLQCSFSLCTSRSTLILGEVRKGNIMYRYSRYDDVIRQVLLVRIRNYEFIYGNAIAQSYI